MLALPHDYPPRVMIMVFNLEEPRAATGAAPAALAAQRWSASSGKSAGEPRAWVARWAGEEAWQQARWKVCRLRFQMSFGKKED